MSEPRSEGQPARSGTIDAVCACGQGDDTPCREHGVRTRAWRNGALAAENFPFEQISNYLQESDCVVWADLCAPDTDRLTTVATELNLDPHAVEDAVTRHERPKATRYRTHLFVVAYAVHFDAESATLTACQVSAFITQHAVITVRQSDSFDIERVVKVWDDNTDLIKYGCKALVHGLLDVIVDGYFEAVEDLDDEIEAIEDILFDDTSRSSKDVQRRSFALRKSLVQGRRAILPMREVVNTTMRRAVEEPGLDELAPYYNDLYDHVLRAAEWTESLRDMITTIFETNLSLADARLNTIMKKLTGYAAIIAVPTAITGYFGQNVPYPGFGQHWGFWLSLLMMLAIAAGLYVVFRRKDWI